MNSVDVYALFEEIKELAIQIKDKLLKTPLTPAPELMPIDVMAVTDLTEEVRKTTKYEHRHIIEIGSSKVFLSMVVMVLTILGLSFAIGKQRETISQYKNNDLKYRYIKMQGKTSEENLYRLERQFWYRDSVAIIRQQVDKYELLVKEQAEKIERAKLEAAEVE
ncbi:MAG: hypothetical protein EZS26_002088 [Candidatus Ordinivivax streblomastigis]|uniref:Uncharacterized protein n=1 Tax=Candidatus Ordinivivax streblomastigis TaxID=2540710 RepID=A0A5M8P033_9BACT|nr:MAG: hypothetical protein EZS26_002088 [Candidatus Ordinivivax streblomastigis]